MSLKKLTCSFPAKVAAVFLWVLCGVGGGLCAAIACAAYICEFYAVPSYNGWLQAAIDWLREEHRLDNYQLELMEEHDRVFSIIFNMRVSSIVLAALALVLFILLFIYLMRAAGRRAGEDGIVLSFFDRIPLELILAAQLFALMMLMYAFEETGRAWGPDDLVIAALLVCLEGAAALLVLLAGLYTFAARVKAGGWWRGTLTYMCLRLLWRCLRGTSRFLRRLFRALRLEWRAALVVTGFFFANVLSFLVFDNSETVLSFMMYAILWFSAFVVVVFSANQFRRLREGGKKLAAGELDHKVNTEKMYFDFRLMGEDLNSIGEGMSAAVDQRMRSERLKTELITNVSHDIKTPLTSIVNYVDLLQKEHTDEEEAQYLDVLKRQSEKLRRLTVDLVEASKASTGNLPTQLVPTSAGELINQAVAEYADRFAQGKLEPIVTLPEKPVTLLADGRHLWRVLDNLFNNAVKYAQAGTRVYIDVRRLDGEAVISVKNISRDRLNVSSDELMERFVRGDSSRHTEGSGLGLSIARSLTELMGGKFDISIDGDLFKAEIRLKLI